MDEVYCELITFVSRNSLLRLQSKNVELGFIEANGIVIMIKMIITVIIIMVGRCRIRTFN